MTTANRCVIAQPGKSCFFGLLLAMEVFLGGIGCSGQLPTDPDARSGSTTLTASIFPTITVPNSPKTRIVVSALDDTDASRAVDVPDVELSLPSGDVIGVAGSTVFLFSESNQSNEFADPDVLRT